MSMIYIFRSLGWHGTGVMHAREYKVQRVGRGGGGGGRSDGRIVVFMYASQLALKLYDVGFACCFD